MWFGMLYVGVATLLYPEVSQTHVYAEDKGRKYSSGGTRLLETIWPQL